MDVFNLKSLKVTKVETAVEDIAITAESKHQPISCDKCGSRELVRFGVRPQKYRDLPIHCKRVEITVNRQRYRCNGCKSILMDELPDMDEKRAATTRLVRHVQTAAIKKPFMILAAELGLDEKTVRTVFKEHIPSLAVRYRPTTPAILGIDEVQAFRKLRCVLTNIQDGCIYNLLPSRDKEHVQHFLHNIPDRHKIKVVCMDMWPPYRDAVYGVLPKAQVVVDKFHVVRMANLGLDTVRKELKVNLKPKQRRTLKKDRFALLKREKNLTEKGKLILQTWTENEPLLKEAHRLKEEFFAIYECSSEAEAREKYRTWEASIPDTLKPKFADLTRAVSNWDREIFNYFRFRVTNALTEGLNGFIKRISRAGRGYNFDILRAKVIYNPDFHKHTMPFADRVDEGEGWGNVMGFASRVLVGVDVSTLLRKFEEGYFE